MKIERAGFNDHRQKVMAKSLKLPAILENESADVTVLVINRELSSHEDFYSVFILEKSGDNAITNRIQIPDNSDLHNWYYSQRKYTIMN